MHGLQPLRFANRGLSPPLRLACFIVLSLLLIVFDRQFHYLEAMRTAISVAVAPLQQAATMPGHMWQRTREFFVTQSSLVQANHQLRHQQQLASAQVSQFQAIQQENAHLRNLLQLPLRQQFTFQTAEIVYAERDVFNRKILINKGMMAKVSPGQVVMDEHGIIGQVTRVYPWLSEITLVTEKNHAVPVQVLRNGLRSVIFGAGDTSQMSLRYMPLSADIQNGDILVTSGIDGVYPPGVPVARVVKVERDVTYPFARIACLPLGAVDQYRHILILSELPPPLPKPEPEVVPIKGAK